MGLGLPAHQPTFIIIHRYHYFIILQLFLFFKFSAYCGGLWLGALRCMVEIAKILKLDDNVDRYKTLLNKGKEAYERKLWNGLF